MTLSIVFTSDLTTERCGGATFRMSLCHGWKASCLCLLLRRFCTITYVVSRRRLLCTVLSITSVRVAPSSLPTLLPRGLTCAAPPLCQGLTGRLTGDGLWMARDLMPWCSAEMSRIFRECFPALISRGSHSISTDWSRTAPLRCSVT